jgi:signal transduction histidine kinase
MFRGLPWVRRLVPRFDDAELEDRFFRARLQESLRPTRGALVVSTFICAAFAIPDVALNPASVWHWLLANRFGICTPLLLAPLIASYFEWGQRRLVPMLAATSVLFYLAQGAGTFAALPVPLRHDTLFAMLVVVVLQYFIFSLPMRVKYVTGLGVSLAHVGLCVLVDLPPHLVFMHAFVVLVLSAGCLYAAWQLEASERRRFAANEDLALRAKQLEAALAALRGAQADLVRAERMASVATLVHGVAHELNNPINYIAGNMPPLRRYCEFLTRVATSLADGTRRTPEEVQALLRLSERKDLSYVADDLQHLTADISEGARRAQLIISDLHSLSSARRGVEMVDLQQVARQTESLLRPRLPSQVHVELDLQPTPPLAARAGQLEQVVLNLADNALRAVGERGAIRISVSSANGEALVRVTDDGPGMTEDVRRQVFEPFFTTRPAGEGSGLGLAIVAAIVHAHQGQVSVDSAPGRGTTFELRLPLKGDLTVTAS